MAVSLEVKLRSSASARFCSRTVALWLPCRRPQYKNARGQPKNCKLGGSAASLMASTSIPHLHQPQQIPTFL